MPKLKSKFLLLSHILIFMIVSVAIGQDAKNGIPQAQDSTTSKAKDVDSNSNTVTIEIQEPGIVKIEDLYAESDIVAVIKIVSGDNENYIPAVYKAEIITAFKGSIGHEIIYFGPYIGYGIGNEYLIFLKDKKTTLLDLRTEDNDRTSTYFGNTNKYYNIMYQGYSVMPIQYVCLFEEKNTSSPCDYGIKFNSYQVIMPKNLKKFPNKENNDGSNIDTRWIRKEELIKYLVQIKNKK